MAQIPHFTEEQATKIQIALEAYALSQGATRRDITESRDTLGRPTALRKHIERVCRSLRVKVYADLPVWTRIVLEDARAISGALAHTCKPWEWDRLDRRVWQVVKEAKAAA